MDPELSYPTYEKMNTTTGTGVYHWEVEISNSDSEYSLEEEAIEVLQQTPLMVAMEESDEEEYTLMRENAMAGADLKNKLL